MMDFSVDSNHDSFTFKNLNPCPPMVHQSHSANDVLIEQRLFRRPYSAKFAVNFSDILKIQPKQFTESRSVEENNELDQITLIEKGTADIVSKLVITEPFLVPCTSPVSSLESDLDGDESTSNKTYCGNLEENIFTRDDEEIEGSLEDEADYIVPFSVSISTCKTTDNKCELETEQTETLECKNTIPLKIENGSNLLKSKVFEAPINNPNKFKSSQSCTTKNRLQRSSSARIPARKYKPSDENRPLSAHVMSSVKEFSGPSVLNLLSTTVFDKDHTVPLSRRTMKTLNYMKHLEDKEKIIRREKKKCQHDFDQERKNDNCIINFEVPGEIPAMRNSFSHTIPDKNKSSDKYRLSFRDLKQNAKPAQKIIFYHEDEDVVSKPKEIVRSRPSSSHHTGNLSKVLGDKSAKRTLRNSFQNTTNTQNHVSRNKLAVNQTPRAQSAPCGRRSIEGFKIENKTGQRSKVEKLKIRSKSSYGQYTNSSLLDKRLPVHEMISQLNQTSIGEGTVSKDKNKRNTNTHHHHHDIKNKKVTFETPEENKRSRNQRMKSVPPHRSPSTFNKNEIDMFLKERQRMRDTMISQECSDLYTKLKDKNVHVSLDTLSRALMKPCEMK